MESVSQEVMHHSLVMVSFVSHSISFSHWTAYSCLLLDLSLPHV